MNQESTNIMASAMQKLLNTLYQGHGLQALVDVATELFDNHITINDITYKILAISNKPVYTNEILENQRRLGYVDIRNIDDARHIGNLIPNIRKSDKVIFMINPETNEEWLFKGIKIRGIFVAEIAIVANNHPFQEIDSLLLEEFSKIVSLEMEKNHFFKENKGTLFNYFFGDLIENKMNDKETLILRAHTLDLTFYEWNQIFSIVDKNNTISIEKKQYICKQLRNVIPDLRWTIYDQTLVFFLSRPQRSILTETEKKHFEEFLMYNQLVAGCSQPYQDLLESPNKYKQSITAAELGLESGWEQYLFDYDEMITPNIMKTLSLSMKPEELLPQYLTPLIAYDAAKKSCLLETLNYYLRYPNDPVRAAKELNIHYNTFLYRINKIKELSEIDLENGDVRFQIQLYFCFVEYIRKHL